MTPSLLLPFHGTMPAFAGPPRFAGARSAVLGRATIGMDAWLGVDCVIRADGQEVHVGNDAWLARRATVHIVHDLLPAIIGHHVTVGANTIIHACTVGDGCVIEDDVTILDGAVIEPDVVIEAGSTVFPRKVLASGFIYAGSPALAVRPLQSGELAARRAFMRMPKSEKPVDADSSNAPSEGVFIARTARCYGQVAFEAGSSLFFSCIADAGSGAIRIGANTNIQDNSVLQAGSGEIVVGPDTTVGHNVRINAGRIGARALVGIGSVLADGTIIEDSVLLAAGATTDPGQVLETGWLWGGRPAKALSKLDDAKRQMMAENILTYCAYGKTFSRLQTEAAP